MKKQWVLMIYQLRRESVWGSCQGSRKILRKQVCRRKTRLRKFRRSQILHPQYLPPPCILPSTLHCPIHLHTESAPSLYTAFCLLGKIS